MPGDFEDKAQLLQLAHKLSASNSSLWANFVLSFLFGGLHGPHSVPTCSILSPLSQGVEGGAVAGRTFASRLCKRVNNA